MNPEPFIQELKSAQEYFHRSSRCLEESDSTFAPAQETMSTAQQVAHVAQTIDWFLEGAFRPEGFDLNFEKHAEEIQQVTSLAAAREWVDRAFTAAIEAIGSADDLAVPLPAGPVMGGAPRFAIVGAICDHTAHHRGVLTVYSRLQGRKPAMPYMEA